MTKIYADRVHELTITQLTGDIACGGGLANTRPFSMVCSDGDTFDYAIISQSFPEWEIGEGTYHSGTNTISRDTVTSSSNGGALVSFSAGVKDIFITFSAQNVSEFTALAIESNGTLLPGISVLNFTSGVTVTRSGGVASVSASGTPLTIEHNGTVESIGTLNLVGGAYAQTGSTGTLTIPDGVTLESNGTVETATILNFGTGFGITVSSGTMNVTGVSTLVGDTDVTITSPTNRQALIYDVGSGQWINGEPYAVPPPQASGTVLGNSTGTVDTPTPVNIGNGVAMTAQPGWLWDTAAGSASLWTFSAGNTVVETSNNTPTIMLAEPTVVSNKYYFEIDYRPHASAANMNYANVYYGIADPSAPLTGNLGDDIHSIGIALSYGQGGQIHYNGSYINPSNNYGGDWGGGGDGTVGFAVDIPNGFLYIYYDRPAMWIGAGGAAADPVAGTNGIDISGLLAASSGLFVPAVSGWQNFQDAWARLTSTPAFHFTPPTGYGVPPGGYILGLQPIADGTILGNNTGASAVPKPISVSNILDGIGGSTRGSIIVRGASGWTGLGAGTSGYVLSTQGTTADPIWISASGIVIQSNGTVESVGTLNFSTGFVYSGSGSIGTLTIPTQLTIESNGTVQSISTLNITSGLTLSTSGSTGTLTASGGGGGSMTIKANGTTESGVDTLDFSTGTTLSVSGTTATITASGGGSGGTGGNAAVPIDFSNGTVVYNSNTVYIGPALTLGQGDVLNLSFRASHYNNYGIVRNDGSIAYTASFQSDGNIVLYKWAGGSNSAMTATGSGSYFASAYFDGTVQIGVDTTNGNGMQAAVGSYATQWKEMDTSDLTSGTWYLFTNDNTVNKEAYFWKGARPVGGTAPAVIATQAPGLGRPAASAGTWNNQNSCTATDIAGGPLVIQLLSFTGGGDNISSFEFGSPGSSPWSITTNIECVAFGENYLLAGIVLRDSGSGKLITFATRGYNTNTAAPAGIGINWWTNTTTYNATPFAASTTQDVRWLRITNDGTHLTYYVSAKGVDWIHVYQESTTAFLSTIDKYGVGGEFSYRGGAPAESGPRPPFCSMNVNSLLLEGNSTGTNPTYATSGQSLFNINRPPASAFTQRNVSGSASVVDIPGGPLVLRDTNNGTNRIWRFLSKTAPGADFTLKAQLGYGGMVDISGHDCLLGLVAYNSGNGKFCSFGGKYSSAVWNLGIARWDSFTSYNSYHGNAYDNPVGWPLWLKLDYVQSTGAFTFSASPDGFDYDLIGTETVSGFIGTFTDVGWGMDFGGMSANTFSESGRLYSWSGV